MAIPKGIPGFALYILTLLCITRILPPLPLAQSSHVVFSIGILAAWRYSWGFLNLTRGNFYNRVLFPRWRRQIDARLNYLLPPKIYIVLTLYRIETETALTVIHASMKEAIACGIPVSIVASIVEFADELLLRQIFTDLNPPEHIRLHIVRIPGTGKRDALAQAFRTISRDMPPEGSVVTVVDGDSVLTPGLLRRCTPFFALRPNLGALTTDELCIVKGNSWMQAWHELRFAQRHLLMASMSLSKRVMTLTGRMSMFRADIITSRDFISHMESDHLDHWRLGKFKFLTGDDKSSLYWVLKNGYEQLYIPDTHIITLEDPPGGNFITATSKLMFRWFGNMLRTNSRVLKLGPHRMPFFIWWAFLDQRLSMWTTLAGPLFAVMLAAQYGKIVFLYYLLWVAFTRGLQSLTLLSARPALNWRYPFLLYYSQTYGSLLKTYALFRLDRQSWTRQKTALRRGLSAAHQSLMSLGSAAVHATAIIVFISAVGWASHYFTLPRLLP